MKILKIIITISLITIFIYYLNSYNSTSINGQIAYGQINKQTHDLLISFYDLKEKKEIKSVNIGKSFTRNIFLDKDTKRIWIPTAYTDNLAEVSNKVKILDEADNITELSFGLSPVDIIFYNDLACIVCLEKGIGDVSTYLIDRNKFNVIKKIQVGGDIFRSSDIDLNLGLYYIVTQDIDNHLSKVSIIDLNTKNLINDFTFPDIPLNGIKLINGNIWLAGGQGIKIINPKTGDLIDEIKTKSIPYQFDFSNGIVVLSHYYPDNQHEEGLSIINPNDFTLKEVNLKNILPTNIGVKGNVLYIVDDMSGNLTLFDIKAEKIIQKVPLGQYPTNLLFIN